MLIDTWIDVDTGDVNVDRMKRSKCKQNIKRGHLSVRTTNKHKDSVVRNIGVMAIASRKEVVKQNTYFEMFLL